MRRLIAVLLLLTLFSGGVSCKRAQEKTEPAKEGIKVLTTFLPIYIFSMNVAEGVPGVSVDVLIPPEFAGPHGYEPTPSDMRKVAEADVLIANGLGLETFLDSIGAVNPDLWIAFASRGIDTLPDVPPERMRGAKKRGDQATAEHHEKHRHNHGPVNPHVWVSPFLAARQVRNIADTLAVLDKANADKYRRNADAYAGKLEALGEEYKKMSASVKKRKIVTIHNSFDYLARDIGIEVVAVLRVDPMSEPRAGELARMADLIRAEDVAAIFTEPQFPVRLAEVLAKETGAPIFQLDPVAIGKPDAGLYEIIMRKNLDTLKKALEGKK